MDFWNSGQEQGRRKMESLDSEFYLMQLLVLRTMLALVSHLTAD